jgi:hypothetical protein
LKPLYHTDSAENYLTTEEHMNERMAQLRVKTEGYERECGTDLDAARYGKLFVKQFDSINMINHPPHPAL